MTLLQNHLEQISLSATAILDLPFPPPKIFTNALLHPHDITALIRDTEVHERALFTVPAPPAQPTAQDPASSTSRRTTAYDINGAGKGSNTFLSNADIVRAPRRNTAVAAILGGDMVEQMRRGGGGGIGSGVPFTLTENREKGEVDVEILLRGAERLCDVYPITGAPEKIAALRTRYNQLASSIAHHESRVDKQTAQLNRMNRPKNYNGDEYDDDSSSQDIHNQPPEQEAEITEEDLKKEEDEIRELEKKKKALEDRVHGMEKDLGGLMR